MDGTKSPATPQAEIASVLERLAAKALAVPAPGEFQRERRECGCEVYAPGPQGIIRCIPHGRAHEEEQARIRGEKARASREAYIGELMARSGVMLEHSTAKLEDFPEGVRLPAERWLDGPQERCGLLVKGPTGTGKTRLAAAIVRPWLIDGGKAWMVAAGDLFARIRATFKDGAKETEEELVSALKATGLLVIDDLGNEGTVSPFVTSVLHRVFSARNGEFRATIVTTNLKSKDIAAIYGQAIASRLGVWDQLVVAGDDKRAKSL